jgi:hypothetical protein
MNKFLSRLADTFSALFPVDQATYIEEWDTHSEINAHDRFIWNLLTEDLWNIDFDYYLLAPYTAWDYSIIKQYNN